MKKILSFLLVMHCSSLTYAQVYWCPENIVCAGIDVITCQKGNFNDVWRVDDQRYSNILNPYFHHVGAVYDANTGLSKCTYSNSSSQGLGLIPIHGNFVPVFKEGLNWRWADLMQSWASCNGHAECPFQN